MKFFINGWASKSSIWNDLMTDDDYCYDISERTNYEDLSDVFYKKYLENNSRPLTLVGWSLGSMLALELLLKQQEKVHRAFLFGGMANFAGNSKASCKDPIIVKNMKRLLKRDINKTLTNFY